MQYFNIQVASQLSGVASATIRAWEKRYNAVVPERADNKHRLYSEKDIEKLAVLFKLTEIGQSIGKIAHLKLEELKEVYSNLLHRPYDELKVVTPHHEKIDFQKILNSFFIALSAYKLDIISHELDKAKSLLDSRDLCLNLLTPLFHQVRIKVETGELTITQEHILSSIVSFQLGPVIGEHYQKNLMKDDLLLIATPEGEKHEIGVLASALLCSHYGIRFIFLGTDLPVEALAQTINTLKPKALLLGLTMKDKALGGKTLEEFLRDLTNQLTHHSEVWIGGNVQAEISAELEKRKIPYFPSLHALDKFLENHQSHL